MEETRLLVLCAPLPPPYGGIAKYMNHVFPYLLNKNYTVYIIQPTGSAENHPLAHRLQSSNFKVGVLEYPGKTKAIIFILRHFFSLLPFIVRYLKPLLLNGLPALYAFDAFIYWCMAAKRACVFFQPEIIHSYDAPWQQGAACLWASRSFNTKSCISVFGEYVPHVDELKHYDAISPSFRSISRYVLEFVDAVASMTEHCRSLAAHIDFPPSNIRLVRFVLGMERYNERNDGAKIRVRYAGDDEYLLLFVGQIRRRKGPQILVESMPRVLSQFPKTKLLIVGEETEYVEELKYLAKSLEVNRSILFTGAIPEEELPLYYAASDVFLFSTITTIECLGLTFVQGMYSGVPVIATNIAGAPEVIQDGVNGFLVESNSVKAFSEKIIELLALDSADRAKIGAAGAETVRKMFPADQVVGDLFAMYDYISEGLGKVSGSGSKT